MELDRNALLVYLNELRMLETIIHESEKRKTKLTSKMNNLKLDVGEEPKRPNSYAIREAYENNKKSTNKCYIVFALFVFCLIIFNPMFKQDSESLFICFIFITIFLAIDSLIRIFVLIGNLNEAPNLKRAYDNIASEEEKYRQKLHRYEEKKNSAEINLNEQKKELNTMNSNVSKEIYEFKGTLQNAYNLNIIPLQFRNIQGIYYLYDYISSSNETLTNALMQANLESIKQKLDKMIELQGTMIIQQAQANQIFFEQNNQMLLSLQNVEQYSKIAAINSELSVRMQAKQLAFQAADFLLK